MAALVVASIALTGVIGTGLSLLGPPVEDATTSCTGDVDGTDIGTDIGTGIGTGIGTEVEDEDELGHFTLTESW